VSYLLLALLSASLPPSLVALETRLRDSNSSRSFAMMRATISVLFTGRRAYGIHRVQIRGDGSGFRNRFFKNVRRVFMDGV